MSIRYLAHCYLSPSAFSGERYFTVRQASGEEYVGIAPIGYCFQGGEEATGYGPGLLSIGLLADLGEELRIRLPDGEAVTVKRAAVVQEMTETRVVGFAAA